MSGGTAERSQVEQARREKLEALKARGIAAFAYRFDRTHTAAQARALWKDGTAPAVAVAGRLVSLRDHGKSYFAHLEDASGQIQLYFKQDVLGADAFELVKLLDLGDHVGVRGTMMKTRAGEITVQAREVELLAKALRPLPLGKVTRNADGTEERHSDFADPELRYRQRYTDLAVHPFRRALFERRARIVSSIRKTLDERGFLEVETPILQPLYGGASAQPFVTRYNALDAKMFLRIADELYLKRLIVGGMERVYEIGKDFRNEGMDRYHNPEFTMLECYQAYADYTDMMELTEALIGAAAVAGGSSEPASAHGPIDFSSPFERISYAQALRQHGGPDLDTADEITLASALVRLDITPDTKLGKGRLIDQLFGSLVEPKLVRPTFVLDFPIELSPLAKRKRGNIRYAERFELFINGAECANAFSELTDPAEQRARFEAQAALRVRGDEEAQPLDEDYIRALEYGMPPTGGLGLGIDRLTMVVCSERSIRDVVLFPAMRPDVPRPNDVDES